MFNCLRLSLLLGCAQGPHLAAQEAGSAVEQMRNVVSAVSPTVCLLLVLSGDSLKNQKSTP